MICRNKFIGLLLLLVFMVCGGALLSSSNAYAANGDFFIISVEENYINKSSNVPTKYKKLKIIQNEKGGYSCKNEDSTKGEAAGVSCNVKNNKLIIKYGPNSKKQTKEIALTKKDIDASMTSVKSALAGEFKVTSGKGRAVVTYKYTFNVGEKNKDVEQPEDEIKPIEEVVENPEEGEEGDGENSDVTCADSGAAGSLGWILCPALSLMGNLATTFYNEAIVPFLKIEPQLFNAGDETNNVLSGWTIFQNIANIVFAILFLIVIFSQLTGVGMDNYGIKKVLPKLIVTAVLINLSYFICILFVDISNILGNSLQALFEGMGENLEVAGEFASSNVEGVAKGALTAAAIFSGLVLFTGGSFWYGFAVVGSLLISGLGVVISLLFLFVILAARQAAVVVLVIISPLAVVCYALPNTKNLFKKWTKLLEAMLILYPVSSLLVGGGDYVSKLLLSAGMGDSFFGALTAMLAGIVPVFFIPSLTKNAFAGMGNLGAKISNIGDKVRGRATGAMTNSRMNQALQSKGQDARALKRAEKTKKYYDGVDADGNPIPKKGSGRFAGLKSAGLAAGRVMSGGSRGVAAAREEAEKVRAAEDNRSQFMKNYEGIQLQREADAASKEGKLEEYSKAARDGKTAEDLIAASKRVGGNDAESSINSTLGKSDAIKAIERPDENGNSRSAAVSRLAAGQQAADQLSKVAGGNEAAEKIQQENAARQVNLEQGDMTKVINAANQGRLQDFANDNNNSDASRKMAEDLHKVTGDNLAGKGTQDILKTIKDNGDLVVSAAKVAGGDNAIATQIASSEVLSGTGMTGDQVNQSIEAAAVRASNQYEISAATNAAGEIRIEHGRAEDLAKQRLSSARSKEHAEEFANQARGDVERILEQELVKPQGGGDPARVVAAIKDISSKGGYENIMNAVYNANIQDPEIAATVDDMMASMTDPVAKQYGKYKAAGGNGTFKEFVDGKAPVRSDRGISSFGQYLETLDENGFNNASKDTIKFINGTGQYQVISSQQAANLAAAAKGEDRTAALKMLEGKIEAELNGREKIAEAYSDSQWSNMSIDLMQTITGTSTGQTVNDVKDTQVKSILENAKTRIANDPRLRSNLKPEVRKFFGL